MVSRLMKEAGLGRLVAVLALLTLCLTGPSAESAQSFQQDIPTEVVLENGYRIIFEGVEYHADNTSNWYYTVEEQPGAQDLGNWVLEIPFCAPILDAGPEPWEVVDPDPNAQLSGIKWETGTEFQRGFFWLWLDTTGQVGLTNVAAKGPDLAFGQIAGPSCEVEEPPPPVDPGDDQPPTIMWVAPVAEDESYELREGETVDLVLDAADNVAIDRVEILRWDVVNEVFTTVAVDREAPYEAAVSASDLHPTWNHIIAASFDTEGNQSEWTGIWLYKIVGGPVFQTDDYLIFLPMLRR